MEHVKQVEPKQEKEALIKKEEEKPVAKEEIVTPTKEIDEHMDPTANYARVLRIRPEEIEDEWESVPYEEGWSQVKTRRPASASSGSSSKIDVNAEINMTTAVLNSHLDKKQRENLARTQKKKEAKLAADKLQEERLKKHKKELEKVKIQEFYSSGKGKNTPWGKNGQRSKTPQSVASINEFGQLIWD
ncbi:uncharacterized protein EV154DRAFT_506521 [Mucor mucedo]|uniref:uncharacterized protein n=1 Tax=Mucor mucedo TaxID=29922 RepID=UPI0022200423|nr:uncharacterized protein EV154DRAFT_506521 [Mucor mucedo]KAI7891974.1 hypothetical protein EV154DRAFT_506521 [Mucor mucedo]